MPMPCPSALSSRSYVTQTACFSAPSEAKMMRTGQISESPSSTTQKTPRSSGAAPDAKARGSQGVSGYRVKSRRMLDSGMDSSDSAARSAPGGRVRMPGW